MKQEIIRKVLPQSLMKKSIKIVAGVLLAIAISYFAFTKISQYRAHNLNAIAPVDSAAIRAEQLPKISHKVLYGVNIDSLDIYEGAVQNNENLASILYNFNVSAQTIAEISNLPKEVFDVRKMRAKKPYTIIHEKDTLKTAKYFIYKPNPIDFVLLDLGDSVVANQGKNKVDTLLLNLSGTIEYSLYQTIVDSGASPLLVNNLADVYAWEIDFFGLQKGDQFKVVYEKYMVEGEQAGIGPIKAAYFKHMGEDFYAIPYDQGEGLEFFDQEGKSLRKTFLKAPLKYNRISSTFSHSRLHPVLKIRRPHHGVDYAAPRGTPVVAVGDGLVTKAAYSGGAGNMVKVKHNSNYETAYLHLWKYGAGIKKGVRVKQGQVIGYVGSTGLSTGPHLDFRFYKNGKAVDPLKIDPPSANPIKEEEKQNFNKVSSYWSEKLDNIIISLQQEII